ncbi:MAG: STAS domain-containing protein [Candidatus Omnitrophota bacterium]
MNSKDICRNANVEIRQSGETLTLKISGVFNKSTTPQIQQCCKLLDKKLMVKKVVLDFDRVSEVDTSAFACIIGFMKQHLNSGAQIYVSRLKDPAKELLRILKIEKIVRVEQ